MRRRIVGLNKGHEAFLESSQPTFFLMLYF